MCSLLTATPDDRRAILAAVLGFANVPAPAPELDVLRGWLDWPGIRWTAGAIHAEHQVLRLARRSDSWTATFTVRRADAAPEAAPSGLGTAPSPGQAVQFAAWQVGAARAMTVGSPRTERPHGPWICEDPTDERLRAPSVAGKVMTICPSRMSWRRSHGAAGQRTQWQTERVCLAINSTAATIPRPTGCS